MKVIYNDDHVAECPEDRLHVIATRPRTFSRRR